jgi:hypothetical protein
MGLSHQPERSGDTESAGNVAGILGLKCKKTTPECSPVMMQFVIDFSMVNVAVWHY